MHLKRVEILGFKSFAAKTVLELDPGIAALVGPNGSGKSNVVDAVRWALGEQSLRAVRSRKSEEVIFAGSSRRAPMGMAEVTLVLDNVEGLLSVPYAEVSLTRRLYRSGEGEYLINRSRARLRDVVDLLSRVGLGPDSYSVVGQGAVDEVLLQRAEERRALLETAADIGRHQAKLRESLDRLAETEANLRRVEDIRAEIGPRLPRLRTQANRARRYEEISRGLREMVLWRCLLQVRETRVRLLQGMEAERAGAERVAAASRGERSARERVARLKELLRGEETALEAVRERLAARRAARDRSERELALAREREAALRRELAQAAEEEFAVRKEQADLEAEIERMDSQRAEMAGMEARSRAEAGPIEVERRQGLAEQRLLQAQLERVSGELQAASRRRSEVQERRGALLREASRLEGVRKESAEAERESATRLARLEEQIAGVQRELAGLREEQTAVETRRQEAQERLRALDGRLEAARRRERQAWERERGVHNRLSLLRSLKEEHRGLPGGARTLLEARLPGIRGTLASMIRVPPEYLAAVAAALGGAQGYVVSEGFREGLEALRFLAAKPGKATIAPLRLEKAESPRTLVEEFRSGMDGLLAGVAFRGMAADLVSCPPEARDLCLRYLGLSLVVESMADALELYRRLTGPANGRVPFQVVTLDGRLLRARGDLALSQNGEKDGSLVARESELADLSGSAERAGADLKEARDAVAALESAQREVSSSIGAGAASVTTVQGRLGKQSALYADLAAQVARAESAIEWHRSRHATAEREASQGREALARAEKEIAEAAGRESEARGRLEQLRGDLAEAQSTVAEVSARLSRCQAETTAVQGRLRELAARAAAVAEAVQRVAQRVKRQKERRAQASETLARLLEEVRQAAPAPPAGELEAAEKQAAVGAARLARLREESDSAEAELVTAAGGLEAARERLAECGSRSQRALAALAALLREAARESNLEAEQGEPGEPETAEALAGLAASAVERLGALLADIPLDSFPPTASGAVEKAEALRREIQALGTVNPEAPEEYRQVSERHAFLTDQTEDLRKADRSLRTAIDDLRELMEARFRETFELVNAEFGRCFSTLFGGGTARLALTRPEQPLEGGVEVVATPPGRKGSGLLGLSGGERALTAVALLFALMKVHPSPFCLLDEVDAALDESNVHRFCTMVRELSAGTQFLVITHNRVTMEMADVLYGVSMSPELVSRVVSLKLKSPAEPRSDDFSRSAS